MSEYANHNIDEIVTPVDVEAFEWLMFAAGMEVNEINYFADGFRNGFTIGYRGRDERQTQANNLPFQVGNKFEL